MGSAGSDCLGLVVFDDQGDDVCRDGQNGNQTDDGRQAEERVFGEIRQNPATYPEHTILQKRMKAHLLAGHTIGMGSGVRILGL